MPATATDDTPILHTFALVMAESYPAGSTRQEGEGIGLPLALLVAVTWEPRFGRQLVDRLWLELEPAARAALKIAAADILDLLKGAMSSGPAR